MTPLRRITLITAVGIALANVAHAGTILATPPVHDSGRAGIRLQHLVCAVVNVGSSPAAVTVTGWVEGESPDVHHVVLEPGMSWFDRRFSTQPGTPARLTWCTFEVTRGRARSIRASSCLTEDTRCAIPMEAR